MNLYSINAGYFKLDGGAMFGVVPKSIWQKLIAPDENNMCNWAMRCLLIEDGERLILVDNGMGNKQDEKFFSYYFLNGDDTVEKSLAFYGFSCDDITDVFLTHLHFDHCGGSIKKENNLLVPAFKNAIYWSNSLHWQWATKPNDREKASFLKENILPIQESGQLRFVDNSSLMSSEDLIESATSWGANAFTEDEEQNIPPISFTSSISIRIVNGHTAAMMLPQIKYKDKTVVFMADLLPSSSHIPIPYVMAYDMFPLTTLAEKRNFLNDAISNDYILFFEHDAMNECCTLQQTERGIRSKNIFKLSDI